MLQRVLRATGRRDGEGAGTRPPRCGGRNGILTQLERAGIDWHSIHDLFVTHTHVVVCSGRIWILRVVCYGMECGNYQGEFHFWGNDEVVAAADKLAHMLLRPSESAFIGKRVFLHAVEDGDTAQILGRPVTFFDIHSIGSAKEFGFAMEYSAGKVLVCSGDEPPDQRELSLMSKGRRGLSTRPTAASHRHRSLQSAPDSPGMSTRGMRDGGASQCGEPRALPYGR